MSCSCLSRGSCSPSEFLYLFTCCHCLFFISFGFFYLFSPLCIPNSCSGSPFLRPICYLTLFQSVPLLTVTLFVSLLTTSSFSFTGPSFWHYLFAGPDPQFWSPILPPCPTFFHSLPSPLAPLFPLFCIPLTMIACHDSPCMCYSCTLFFAVLFIYFLRPSVWSHLPPRASPFQPVQLYYTQSISPSYTVFYPFHQACIRPVLSTTPALQSLHLVFIQSLIPGDVRAVLSFLFPILFTCPCPSLSIFSRLCQSSLIMSLCLDLVHTFYFIVFFLRLHGVFPCPVCSRSIFYSLWSAIALSLLLCLSSRSCAFQRLSCDSFRSSFSFPALPSHFFPFQAPRVLSPPLLLTFLPHSFSPPPS